MRLVLSIPVLIMLGIGAQAMPLAPLQSVPDSPIAVQMKMGHSENDLQADNADAKDAPKVGRRQTLDVQTGDADAPENDGRQDVT